MSISKMKKLVLIAPSDGADEVIGKLLSLRCVHIAEFSDKESFELLTKKSFNEEIIPLEQKLEKIDRVISALSKYVKKSYFKSIAKSSSREVIATSEEYASVCGMAEKAYFTLLELEKVNANEYANEEENTIESEFEAFSCQLDKLCALYDIERTNLEILKVKEKAAYSDTCTFVLGWIPKRAQEKVQLVLDECLCAYEIEDPDDDDEPPVRIFNNPITRCFEWITKGNGTPKFSFFDPTGVTSVFTFVAFGLMLHDVGYGLILAIIGLAGAAMVGIRGKYKAVFNTIGICGFSSMTFGVLLGGWFGNLPYAIMQNIYGIENAAKIVPLFEGTLFKASRNPIFYLILCMGIGVLQMLTRMIIKIVLFYREGRIKGAFGFRAIGRNFLDFVSFLKIFAIGVGGGILTYFINLSSTLGLAPFALLSVVGHTVSICLVTFSATVIAKSIQEDFLTDFCTFDYEEFVPSIPCEKYTLEITENVKMEAV